MSQKTLEGQAAILPVSASAISLGTLQATSAVTLVQGAREMANALADVIERQHLAVVIQGRKYVRIEGWTTLAVMLGVMAREVSTVEQDGIYTATVELVRMSDGACISRASAECGSDDELDRYGKPVWANRPRYARRSMAQTRATGKACRLAFSWIMALAGYEPTPAEEMPDLRPDERSEQQQPVERLITENQRKLLEARISQHQLNREGVKTWVMRRFGVEHFHELSRQQLDDVLDQLPRMAEIKAEREAREEATAEREAIQAEGKPEPEPEPEPKQGIAQAEHMENMAKDLRAAGRHQSGKVRPREAVEAEILRNEARYLRQKLYAENH